MRKVAQTALKRVRAITSKLEVEERTSHGAPAFFLNKKQFLHFWDNHHGDDRVAIWVRADREARDAWLQLDPERFFLPPYVAHLGWVGIRLDGRPPWKQIEAIIREGASLAKGQRR
ncbi:MAG: MmcQ/YjbR family DNA-binding protein [Myxococcaceae bacterium]